MTSGQTGGRPASPLPFDAEALQVVRSSARGLDMVADAFIRRLHQDIGTLIPVVNAMTGDGWPFCERMARGLVWVALTDQSPAFVADVLRQVGMANRDEGFPETEYVSVAHALVRAVRAISEHEWSTSMGSAWISCFQWMQPHLLAGARLAGTGPEDADRPGPAAGQADDQDDEFGYGQIMVSMTLNSRRERPRRET